MITIHTDKPRRREVLARDLGPQFVSDADGGPEAAFEFDLLSPGDAQRVAALDRSIGAVAIEDNGVDFVLRRAIKGWRGIVTLDADGVRREVPFSLDTLLTAFDPLLAIALARHVYAQSLANVTLAALTAEQTPEEVAASKNA